MEIAGVTASSKAPTGGRIEMAGGKPSGIFVDAASELVGKHVPPPSPRDRDAALVEAQAALLKVGVTPAEQHPDYAWSGEYIQDGSAIWWTYQYLLNPITSTVFSMLAFYVASAAFRAFRAKNLEAVLLLVGVLLVRRAPVDVERDPKLVAQSH